MNNPFETLHSDIIELKGMVTKLLNQPAEDYTSKWYSINEAAELLKVDRQTIRNHIDKGNIKASYIGRRILIVHSELFDSLNEVKSIKYKR
ncbi:helix-turn-helix domain-containing protein [Zobellia russellii]|uniref:helix-turn-helix domain-containing protein n=1 Tax=Zobellia russellii TaxID=248907 RepID=UPI001BFF3C13|nr:helix-turn-helix domain-containing protein [Zobellia russellii]MBT9187769.1 helix-turn-helix domain-containing protein [Zobellia russellii]